MCGKCRTIQFPRLRDRDVREFFPVNFCDLMITARAAIDRFQRGDLPSVRAACRAGFAFGRAACEGDPGSARGQGLDAVRRDLVRRARCSSRCESLHLRPSLPTVPRYSGARLERMTALSGRASARSYSSRCNHPTTWFQLANVRVARTGSRMRHSRRHPTPPPAPISSRSPWLATRSCCCRTRACPPTR